MALIDNLVAYWSLDESSGNAIDAHGSNDLTDNNSVGSATGLVSGARDFVPASNHRLSRADNTDLSTGDIDFTVGLWVKFDALASHRSLLSKWSSSGSKEYWLLYFQTPQRIRFAVRNTADTEEPFAEWTSAPSAGQWYFVLGWHDSVNNSVNLQINNGTPVSTSHSGGVRDGNQAFMLGSDTAGISNPMDGLLDEAFLWKRVLTSDERTWLYNSGAGRSYADIVAGMGGSAALSGTITDSTTEADIVAGGKTIILTLSGDTFISN